MRQRWWVLSAFLAAAMFASPQARAAGGAFAVDDSGVGEPGECKVESWASFADNTPGDVIGVISPACVVKLGVPVELGAAVQRARSADTWSTSLGIKGKVNLLPAGPGAIGVGLSASTAWDRDTGYNTGFLINVPFSFEVSPAFRININGGWSRDSVNKIDYASWGAGFEWNFAGPVTLIGEVYGLAGRKTEDTEGTKVTDPRAQIGLRFTPVKALDFDVIYGRNLTGEDANWVTVGMNLRF